MASIEEVYVRDLYKKHNGKDIYKGFFTIGKKVYQEDGEVVNESIALDREALEILRARIMAILIDETKPNSDCKIKGNGSKQTKLF